MSDWLCQDCKSVNSSSAQNCYRCWTPRKFGEAPDAATLPPGVTAEEAHEERQRALRPSASDARSSRRRSWIVLACITVTVAFSALSLAFVGAKGGSLGVAMSLLSGDWTVLGSLLSITLVGGALSVAAMIAWFVWFDRVLANVPALTGKWPEVSRVMAVVWWVVPVVGQLKGTFVVGHVYDLMAVAGSPGLWLLGLWGVTWIGGTLAPSVAGFVVGWLPLPLEESVHLQDLISNLGQISYIAAGFFAAALILALEHARDVRAAGPSEDADAGLDVPLADRLAGRTTPAPSPVSWSGAPPSWPTGPGSAQDAPKPWPGASTPWASETDAHPGGPTGWPMPSGPPGWPASSPGPTGGPSHSGGPPAWPATPTASTGWPAATDVHGVGAPGAPAWPGMAAVGPQPGEPPGPADAPDHGRLRRRRRGKVDGAPGDGPDHGPLRGRRRGKVDGGPADRGPADRRPVPLEPILLMGVLVLAGAVAGVTMAGTNDPFGALGRLVGQGAPSGPTSTASPTTMPGASPDAGTSLPTPAGTPLPRQTTGVATTPSPTGAPGASVPPAASSAPATPAATQPVASGAAPSATPVAADLVARRLVRMVTAEDYRGLMDIHASSTDAAGETTWTVKVGRVGEREYRLRTIERPGADPDVLERAALVSSVWERDDTTDWAQRRKTDDDRATPPLFDVTDADQLTPDGRVVEDGETLYRFGWDAGDARLQQFLRSIGADARMQLADGELLTTADGVPVRLELRFEGRASGAPTSLRMTIRYSEVGSDIEVRSPRVGPPLVVRS